MSIDAVIRLYEEELMRLPDVKGVAPLEKDGKIVIQLLMKRKIPEATLMKHKVVRDLLAKGYEVVMGPEIGDVTAQSQTDT